MPPPLAPGPTPGLLFTKSHMTPTAPRVVRVGSKKPRGIEKPRVRELPEPGTASEPHHRQIAVLGKTYNPNEPRDADGKWTAGAGASSGEAKPAAYPAYPGSASLEEREAAATKLANEIWERHHPLLKKLSAPARVVRATVKKARAALEARYGVKTTKAIIGSGMLVSWASMAAGVYVPSEAGMLPALALAEMYRQISTRVGKKALDDGPDDDLDGRELTAKEIEELGAELAEELFAALDDEGYGDDGATEGGKAMDGYGRSEIDSAVSGGMFSVRPAGEHDRECHCNGACSECRAGKALAEADDDEYLDCRDLEAEWRRLRTVENTLWNIRYLSGDVAEVNDQLVAVLLQHGLLGELTPADRDASLAAAIKDVIGRQRALLGDICGGPGRPGRCPTSSLCATTTPTDATAADGSVGPEWDNVRGDSSHHSSMPLNEHHR
jgi:hypothetical protein